MIAYYEPELVYDLAHFGFDHSIFDTYAGWHTVYLIILVSLRDPSSWLFSVMHDWDYPMTREDGTLRTLVDVVVQAFSSKRKPLPMERPFRADKSRKRVGSTRVSTGQARHILNTIAPNRKEGDSGGDSC